MNEKATVEFLSITESRRQMLELRAMQIEKTKTEHDQWYLASLITDGETEQIKLLASEILEESTATQLG